MIREVPLFAVGTGRVRNEYEITLLGLSTKGISFKVFSACR